MARMRRCARVSFSQAVSVKGSVSVDVATRGATCATAKSCWAFRDSWSGEQTSPFGSGAVSLELVSSQAPNKQLQRTVIPNRWRAASASFHCAHAARWTRGHAAAELRRYTAR